MARTDFGRSFAAWLVSTSTDPDTGVETVIVPSTSTTLQIYDAPDGSGTLVSDFLDASGNPVSEIVVPAGTPYIPKFSGPDGMDVLWVQAATSEWLPIPHDVPDGGLTSADVGTTVAPLSSGVVPDANLPTPRALVLDAGEMIPAGIRTDTLILRLES